MSSASPLRAIIDRLKEKAKANAKSQKFPCPYCKGQGGEFELVTDYEGIRHECGVCKGEGMIVIDGPIHKRMQRYAKSRKPKPRTIVAKSPRRKSRNRDLH